MSASPYEIDGQAVVSFSGGRTSGYMLRRILGEGLRPDVHVIFADTGKERAETYNRAGVRVGVGGETSSACHGLSCCGGESSGTERGWSHDLYR